MLLTDHPALEYRVCPHHPSNPFDHYSMSQRAFKCQECVAEIRGTPHEAEVNALPVSNVVTFYQTEIDLQQILDLDQELT